MRILVYIGLLLLPVLASAQDVQQLLKEAAALETNMRDADAFVKYQQVIKAQPSNLHALCKCSELSSKLGHRQKEQSVQVTYYNVAYKYADLALKVNPSSPDANFVMALAMGRMALVSSGRKQVEAVNDIKKYAERTIKYGPNDFRGYHVLGKWYYEITNLGSFKRTAVKVFYGGFPSASYEDAIRYYEKSMALNPDFNLNYLELAKVYHKTGRPDKARELLHKLQAMPHRMEDDKRIKDEGAKLLASLK